MNQLSELVSVLPRVLLPATGWLNVSDHHEQKQQGDAIGLGVGQSPVTSHLMLLSGRLTVVENQFEIGSKQLPRV